MKSIKNLQDKINKEREKLMLLEQQLYLLKLKEDIK